LPDDEREEFVRGLLDLFSVMVFMLALKIQNPDGTTSHSTRPPKNGDQVAGYKRGKARMKF
jgi:hypothetical protein